MISGLKKTFNYEDNAAAFVLGLNKTVVKTHGSSEFRE
jgi:fatty acid/phospholipid biosynthesis enzyme